MTMTAEDQKRHGFGRAIEKGVTELNMPNNLPAEAAVIGSVLYDNRNFDRVSEVVSETDFYAPANEEIWRTIKSHIQAGRVADGIAMREYFQDSQILKDVGGPGYLGDLLDSAAFGPEINDYARMVHADAQRRRIITAAQKTIDNAMEARADPAHVLSRSREHLDAVEAFSMADSDTIIPLHEAVDLNLSQMEHTLAEGKPLPVGVSTGLHLLDSQIGRMHAGDLIVLAGRPSMGKTLVATNIVTNATVRKDDTGENRPAKVAFFELEMTADQLANRVSSQTTRRFNMGNVAYRKARSGALGQSELADLRASASHVSQTIMLDTQGNLSIDKICARAKAMKRRMRGLDLIVVDYLQIVGDIIASAQNRVNVVGQVTARLKALAKELGVPVVCLSQLSRNVENREDKRPHLADLRDSGSIEQDADVVIFVYRHEYYLEKQEPDHGGAIEKWGEWKSEMSECEGRIDLICSKVRNGPTGTVSLHAEMKNDIIVNSKDDLKEEDLF